MSRESPRSAAKRKSQAHVFAALGDETRLALVTTLCQRSAIFDCAVNRRVQTHPAGDHETSSRLQDVGLVRGVRAGRESLFELDPQPIREIRDYLNLVSAEWDQALARLKAFVEK